KERDAQWKDGCTDLLVGYGRRQWPILVSNGNHDHRWTIGRKSGAERFLDLLLRSGQNARAAETHRGGYDVQAGKVKPRDIRSILQFGEFLEDGVLLVPRNDEDDLQPWSTISRAYSLSHVPLLISPKTLTQNPLEYLAGAVLR